MEQATIINIERGSSEDGPGIRTVVFFKGCGLRCKWCANPESQRSEPEILYIANVCVNCAACVDVCKQNAISYREGFGYITDSSRCNLCGDCIRNCFINARKLQGVTYTPESLLAEVIKDEAFFHRSGGGVTLSGGEPLLYTDFICRTAELLHERKIPVLVETCGFVQTKMLQKAASCVDEFFYDFKHIDPEEHKRLTGQDNTLILQNLSWLLENFQGSVSVRYPYIPGCNDSEAAIRGFLEYMSNQKRQVEIVFLPYHRLGLPKYIGLGREYEMGDMKSLKREALAHIHGWAADYGLTVKIQ